MGKTSHYTSFEPILPVNVSSAYKLERTVFGLDTFHSLIFYTRNTNLQALPGRNQPTFRAEIPPPPSR